MAKITHAAYLNRINKGQRPPTKETRYPHTQKASRNSSGQGESIILKIKSQGGCLYGYISR